MSVFRSFLLAALVFLHAPGLAGAREGDVALRILPGWQSLGPVHIAALDLVLEPGWKTYWRSPGEAGMSPDFDWSGSRNLLSVEPLWPAPSVFGKGALQTIGYRDRLTLPLRITPRDPEKPIEIALTLSYGICKTLCIPRQATLFKHLDPAMPTTGRDRASIIAALARQAEPAQEAGFALLDCGIEDEGAARLAVRIDSPPGFEIDAVVFEAHDPDLWISNAEIHSTGGEIHATSEVYAGFGETPRIDPSDIRVTVLGEARALEFSDCSPTPR